MSGAAALIRPEVIAGWIAFSVPKEGKVPYPYLDTHKNPHTGEPDPLLTVGIGCLIDPVTPAVLALPWLTAAGAPASPAYVRAALAAVKSMTGGMLFSRYKLAKRVELSDADIDKLALARLQAAAEALAKVLTDFASWPWQAQMAALSMAYAMGAGFVHAFHHWLAAALIQDWKTCAATCAINAAGNPGVIPRNTANRQLFLDAAAAVAATPSDPTATDDAPSA